MKRAAWLLMLAGAAWGCKKSKPEPTPEKGATAVPEHREEGAHEDIPKLVKLTPEVIREADVRTEPARPREPRQRDAGASLRQQRSCRVRSSPIRRR